MLLELTHLYSYHINTCLFYLNTCFFLYINTEIFYRVYSRLICTFLFVFFSIINIQLFCRIKVQLIIVLGAGARSGDSGGGLLFLNKAGLLFLRGIVSTRDKYSNNSIATFTDLTHHTDWIYSLYQDSEKEILKMKTVIGSKG